MKKGSNNRFCKVSGISGPLSEIRIITCLSSVRLVRRVIFQDLDYKGSYSAPVKGTFRTPPKSGRDIFFVWGGDTADQGWGINPDFGGMKIYETMRQLNPDFFIHSGDNIYADGPIQAQVTLDDDTIWKNITTPEKSKVAETLTEFRGNYIYNLLDESIKRFNAEVPILAQWDDHETRNNWYPGLEETLQNRELSQRQASIFLDKTIKSYLRGI